MSLFNLPHPLDNIFAQSHDHAILFDHLMVAMVELLNCDRCSLYVRDPDLLIGQTLHCHCVHPDIPNTKNSQHQSESLYLSEKEPLFAAALQCEATIFIEDMDSIKHWETGLTFFPQNYSGQTALIQAHICLNSQLWGIFQASVFERCRTWTSFDRNLVSQVMDKITPFVSVYVRRKLRRTVQHLHDGDQ